ncbi:MAG: hypothetical protein J0H35_01985 [Rhodospirillales bacterium]|nr:hypothetical protein [Rhodospirillales bacterium]
MFHPKPDDFLALLQAMPLCVILHDAQTKEILWANNAALAVLGFTLEELVPLKAPDMTAKAPQYRRSVGLRWLEGAARTGQRTIEWCYRSKQGVEILSEAVATRVHLQERDVLVDLAGHTAGSRLLVFARKPAPVQVAYILGHGSTSGLVAMDAFIADATLVPPAADALFSERVVRLPRIPIAYRPPADMPAPTSLPARTTGHVTFGYFGRPERLSPRVIATWARILRVLPSARLVLNSRPFFEPAFRDLYRTRFAEEGIGPDRLDLTYTHPQPRTWEAYGRIDIGLDPFPHNAGTTTIEALWQGVPVLTLADRPPVGRFGASILRSVGLDDWIAPDLDAYVARAVAAATQLDLDALSDLRAALRARVQASALCDADDLARCLERTYRELIEAWHAHRAVPIAAE